MRVENGSLPDTSTVSMSEEHDKLELDLVGLDGNAFTIMAFFRKKAMEAGWSKERIEAVLNEATSKDYNHLIATILEQ